jgi:hypothetical protein
MTSISLKSITTFLQTKPALFVLPPATSPAAVVPVLFRTVTCKE